MTLKVSLGLLLTMTVATISIAQDLVKDTKQNKYDCRAPDSKIYQKKKFSMGYIHRYDIVAGLNDPNESSTAKHKAICIEPDGDLILWYASNGNRIVPNFHAVDSTCGVQPFYSQSSDVGTLLSDFADPQYERCMYEVTFPGTTSIKGDPHIIIRPAQPDRIKAFKTLIQVINDSAQPSEK